MALTQPKIDAAREAAQQANTMPQQAMAQAESEVFGLVISTDEIMVLLLALAVGFLVYHFWKAQRARPEFNLIDLVLDEDGRVSPERFIVMVAFSLHSWTVLKWILSGAVSTADFATYGAIWVTPLIVSIIRKPKAVAVVAKAQGEV